MRIDGRGRPADRYLITPFFLDQPAMGHLRLNKGGAWINQPTMAPGPRLIRIGAVHEPLATAVQATIAAGQRPVSIAGDCCAVIPVITGLQRAGLMPRLLWLDAHGDFNTPDTSPSGFLGGMPLAMLVGRGDTSLLQTLGTELLDEADVLLCDARDLDREEALALAGSKVVHCRTLDALLAHPLTDRPLHVHFDTDFLSLEDAPAMLYPAPGGPRLAELGALGRHLTGSAAPVSVSVTTWDFERDTGRRTERACLEALGLLLGGETSTTN